MIPFLFLMFVITIAQNTTNDPYCINGVKNDNNTLCCHLFCNICGDCLNNDIEVNININKLCCATNIINNNLSCNDTIAPCIIVNKFPKKFFDDPFGFIDNLNLPLIVIIIIVIIGAVMLSCCLICCCFSDKEPPIDYDGIVGIYE